MVGVFVCVCVPTLTIAQSLGLCFSLCIRMLSHAASEHLRATTECRSNRDQLSDGHRLCIPIMYIYIYMYIIDIGTYRGLGRTSTCTTIISRQRNFDDFKN